MNRRFLDDLSLAMADVYAAVTDQLLVNLARHFKLIKGGTVPGSWDYQVRKLAEMGQVTKESRDIILKMLGDADGALKNVLEQAIMDGLKDADPILRKAAEKGFITGVASELAPNQMQAFQMYYQQSADKLNLVNTVMLESTQQAYQSTVADIVSKIDTTQKILNTATGEIITGVDPFNKVLRQSVRKMVNNGLTGFIDHGGHHWSPEAYVAMDMRTTMTNTAREAVAERSREMGCDLYQVSSHNGARPLCYPWQGKVISRNGWTGVVEDFEGNKITVHSEDEIESFRYGGGLFGVNCGHYPIPFVPGFSRSRPPQQDEEANAKEYAESQEQRRLERELRGEKRELAVMKAQGATEEEITAQKARITQANNNLDSFCDSTGRARRRELEYTPINATWPDDYKQTYYERGTIRRNPLNQTTTKNVAQNATPAPTEQYTIEGHTEKLKRTMTESEYKEFATLANKAETAKLYATYGDSCADVLRVRGGGRYTSWDTVEYDFSNHSGQSRYSVAAHEMAHMFDAKIGETATLTFKEVNTINDKCTSGTWKIKVLQVKPSSSDEFLAAMRKDKETLRELLSNQEELTKMRSGTWRNATAGVQDAMDGFFGTQDKYILPWGHGNRYYNRNYNRRFKDLGLEKELKEAYKELGFNLTNQTAIKQQTRDYETASELWANVLSALTCGGEELDAFKQYMPETVKIALQIIGGL